jgi:hypothetical protein
MSGSTPGRNGTCRRSDGYWQALSITPSARIVTDVHALSRLSFGGNELLRIQSQAVLSARDEVQVAFVPQELKLLTNLLLHVAVLRI